MGRPDPLLAAPAVEAVEDAARQFRAIDVRLGVLTIADDMADLRPVVERMRAAVSATPDPLERLHLAVRCNDRVRSLAMPRMSPGRARPAGLLTDFSHLTRGSGAWPAGAPGREQGARRPDSALGAGPMPAGGRRASSDHEQEG